MIVCLNSLSFSKKRMSIKISARWNEAYVLSSYTMSQWLQEFPYVRYRAARSAATDSTSTTTGRDLVPTKVAAALWDRLMKYKTNLLNFPQVETCELIIVDRSIDPIAAVIHEWTYDAMCHDLLDLDGNKYIYETTNGGRRENKEVLLEEHDPVWVELRDLFIADVCISTLFVP
jgi:syntaxin-binding protein 1